MKSILKSLIGEYALRDRREEEEYFKEIMMMYKESMKVTLKKVFPNKGPSLKKGALY